MTLFCINKRDRLSNIIDYYSTYHSLYLEMWGNMDNLAIHMGYYDNTINSHEDSLLKMNEYISTVSNISKNDQVLDAGCGVGGTSIWLAKKFNCNVTGISLANNEIELAKKFAIENKVDRYTNFHKMDYNRMNFQDNTFDVIIALESLCHAKNKIPFLESSYKILRNKGRLIISDYFITDDSMSLKQHDEIEKLSNDYAVDLYSFAQFKKIIDSTSFTSSKFLDITPNILNSYVEGMIQMDKTLEKTNDNDLRMKIREELDRNNIEYNYMKEGIMKYGIIYAQKTE